LLVYRVTLFPNIRRTVALWREVCRKEGLGDVYLAMVESFGLGRRGSARPQDFGFDAAVEFPPHEAQVPAVLPSQVVNPDFRGRVFDFRTLVAAYASRPPAGYVRFRGVAPAWDNTPRRQNDGVAFAGSSPGAYRAWLERALRDTREQNFGEERLVFINAWNEWAEGGRPSVNGPWGAASDSALSRQDSDESAGAETTGVGHGTDGTRSRARHGLRADIGCDL
jgi:hypothetical protein